MLYILFYIFVLFCKYFKKKFYNCFSYHNNIYCLDNEVFMSYFSSYNILKLYNLLLLYKKDFTN